ncbi:hypothetical protein [Epilithonimonas vandammei]|uniref:hypothetical protein n=1 Tax=Epilithonimonas vandammei TaxID=2487072 RepID=UPI001E2BEA20|nr:hypothetical protein [Epilithonimonas vandammei]
MRFKFSIILTCLNLVIFSHQAASLSVVDTRAVNSSPDFYSRTLTAEFKAREAIGVAGQGGYSGMLTLAPWSDNSGNKVHQLNFNDGGLFCRNGLHLQSWGNWNKILMADVNGNVGIGTDSPESLLDVKMTGSFPLFRGEDSYIATGIKFRDDSYTLPGKVKEWAIYKGGVGWREGLGFMRYDAVNPCANGGICDVPLILMDNGDVEIGLPQKSVKIFSKIDIADNVRVNAKIEAKEIKVTQSPTADFVFEETYHLPTLESVERHIK